VAHFKKISNALCKTSRPHCEKMSPSTFCRQKVDGDILSTSMWTPVWTRLNTRLVSQWCQQLEDYENWSGKEILEIDSWHPSGLVVYRIHRCVHASQCSANGHSISFISYFITAYTVSLIYRYSFLLTSNTQTAYQLGLSISLDILSKQIFLAVAACD